MFAATAVALTAVLTAGTAGCGNPEFTYVNLHDGEIYFKVPASWRQVDQKALQEFFEPGDPASAMAQIRKERMALAAYDAHAEPSVSHFYGLGTQDEPFVFVRTTALFPTERDAISLNSMRDAFLPFTADRRRQLEQLPGYPLSAFEPLIDEVVHPGDGVRGVHVRFNYAIRGARTQTFDVTSYLAADGQRVSTMMIRCSAECYRKRAQELDKISKSFTIKRPIG
ncbi:hypothetical protein [Planobispora rosea]|uniref:hypothetical protein n=1 Tax=Planobispora rosea TaxID=35762 RepID=UPI00083B7B2D|nr:hypothetical protein [Planobispora rosea]